MIAPRSRGEGRHFAQDQLTRFLRRKWCALWQANWTDSLQGALQNRSVSKCVRQCGCTRQEGNVTVADETDSATQPRKE
eukprot:2426848-Pleurochrysis_carterae.AAC.4